MIQLANCAVRAIEDAEARRLIEVVRTSSTENGLSDLSWLLAHCDDGVVWGKNADAGWMLSSDPFPEVSPSPGQHNLQQLRLFGKDREILIWRVDAEFRGRELADTPDVTEHDALRPKDMQSVILGDRLIRTNGDFSLVGDGRSSTHAVPLLCAASDFDHPKHKTWPPLRVGMRHYFTSDRDTAVTGAEATPAGYARDSGRLATGLVRIAATRLVFVTKKKTPAE